MQQLLLVVVETGAEKMHFELQHRLNRTSKCLKAVTDPENSIRFFAYRVYKSIGPAALEVNRPDIRIRRKNEKIMKFVANQSHLAGYLQGIVMHEFV